MKFYARFWFMIIVAASLVWLIRGGAQPVNAQQEGITINFTNVTNTIKLKEKIDKSTMTTNVLTNCTIKASVVISNTSTSSAPAFFAQLWIEEPTTNLFDGNIEVPMTRKESALKGGKSKTVKIDLKFNSDQAGTYFLITDTNLDLLSYTQIPPAPQ